MNPTAVNDYLVDLQNRIVAELEHVDGHPFRQDRWQRGEGGGGESRIIEDGSVFERGGVNFSRVEGERLPAAASAVRPELAGRGFQAMGVSLVLHPRNPFVPTVHMNVRFLVATKPGSDPVWWFGGGMDLTPYYGFEEDARHFHSECRKALESFGADLYPRFKRWCARGRARQVLRALSRSSSRCRRRRTARRPRPRQRRAGPAGTSPSPRARCRTCARTAGRPPGQRR